VGVKHIRVSDNIVKRSMEEKTSRKLLKHSTGTTIKKHHPIIFSRGLGSETSKGK